MNWCQPHWNQLRQAIKDRGLDEFGAKTGEEAAAEIANQLDGGEEKFDPLMGSWSRLNSFMADSLTNQGRGQEVLLLKCPMCILVEDKQPHLVEQWINGCTDDARAYAVSKGLVKTS